MNSDVIFRSLAYKDWSNHSPIPMNRRNALPGNMLTELIESIRSGSGIQHMVTIFAFSPSAYSHMANIPGVYIYGLSKNEKDMALINIYVAEKTEGIGNIIICSGISVSDIQCLFDRSTEMDLTCITIETISKAAISTVGGLGLHLSRHTPPPLTKKTTHAILSGEVTCLTQGKNTPTDTSHHTGVRKHCYY